MKMKEPIDLLSEITGYSQYELDERGSEPILQPNDCIAAIEDYAKLAIAEHEEKQWQKYHDNMQLENAKNYIVQTEKFGIMMCSWHSPAWVEGKVIAFRELPKPYQP